MKKALLFTAKSIGLVIILMLIYIIITYTVEQLGVVSKTPLTIPNYTDNHIINMYIPLPFLIVRAGWAYFLAVVTFHFLKTRKLKDLGIWGQLGLGIGVAMSFFLFWWTFGELFDPEVLREGLIVYPVTGIALALLHKLFFPAEYSG